MDMSSVSVPPPTEVEAMEVVPPPTEVEAVEVQPTTSPVVFKAKKKKPTPKVVLTSANYDKREWSEAFLELLEEDSGHYFQVLQAESPSKFYLDYLADQKRPLNSEEKPTYFTTDEGLPRPLFWAGFQKYYECPKNAVYIKRLGLKDGSPIAGRMYAMKLGKYWERVRVLKVFCSERRVQILPIDLGNKMEVSWVNLLELHPTFFGYPPATFLVASLTSIAPVDNDGWSRQVCKEFKNLVVGQRFFVIIKKKTAATYPDTNIGICEVDVALLPVSSKVTYGSIRSINAELVMLGLAEPVDEMSDEFARVRFPTLGDEHNAGADSDSDSSHSSNF